VTGGATLNTSLAENRAADACTSLTASPDGGPFCGHYDCVRSGIASDIYLISLDGSALTEITHGG
jgi:hypothetical protein